MMTQESVIVVVFSADKTKILLQKREDFRIWGLPAGRVEANETREEAGVRETLEETGYHIEIVDYVGEYHRPQLPNGGDKTYVFTGRAIGGSSDNHGWEAVAVDWYYPEDLPKRTVGFAREYITDALQTPLVPVQKTQLIPSWKAWIIRIGFKIRNLRNQMLGRS
nr:putative integron gene cassette protein [uncultured bacterium]